MTQSIRYVLALIGIFLSQVAGSASADDAVVATADIVAPWGQVIVGEPLFLKVTLRNNSDREAQYPLAGAWGLTVETEEGGSVQLRPSLERRVPAHSRRELRIPARGALDQYLVYWLQRQGPLVGDAKQQVVVSSVPSGRLRVQLHANIRSSRVRTADNENVIVNGPRRPVQFRSNATDFEVLGEANQLNDLLAALSPVIEGEYIVPPDKLRVVEPFIGRADERVRGIAMWVVVRSYVASDEWRDLLERDDPSALMNLARAAAFADELLRNPGVHGTAIEFDARMLLAFSASKNHSAREVLKQLDPVPSGYIATWTPKFLHWASELRKGRN